MDSLFNFAMAPQIANQQSFSQIFDNTSLYSGKQYVREVEKVAARIEKTMVESGNYDESSIAAIQDLLKSYKKDANHIYSLSLKYLTFTIMKQVATNIPTKLMELTRAS
ncbi:hypothetical protein [Spartinivicinus poritis]|uniref:Uncharacterized protein n=1 Tax=Spartinivicinus poritis TaxID=2994640 RepID=A0ABT5U700_9GAMM|nr:hypothetical protein [Spartinivicinus sp. A2-2]MDE1460949.1 hypothetical protein [Spartinivicinus sp. A2-2]